MIKRIILVIGVIVCLAGTSLFAQGVPASNAFREWKAKAVAKAQGAEISYQAIAVTTTRASDGQIRVQMAFGTSLDRTSLGTLTIVAQPLSVKDGEVVKVGNEAKLRAGSIQRNPESSDEILFKPSMVLPNGDVANAVRIRITGLGADSGQASTLVVAVDDIPRTSVLGQVNVLSENNALSEEACIWWVGYCDSCILCVGCSNNSPSLNCVECTMGCSGEPTCTPAGPKPFDCP